MQTNSYCRFRLSLVFLLAITLFFAFACSDDEEATEPLPDGDDTVTDGDDDMAETVDETEVADESEEGDTDEEAELQNPLPFEPAGENAAPDPMAMGPFPVGVKTFDFFDESRPIPDSYPIRPGEPRWLRTEIWYPAVQSAKDGPFFDYDLKEEAQDEKIVLGEMYDRLMESDLEGLPTLSVRDAEMDTEHGPYPVIFFSHGSNGIRFQSTFYTIHLASHGYIVISPDHEFNTLWDIVRDGWSEGTVAASAPKRLDDMSFLMDKMEEFNEGSEPFFEGMMDFSMAAITGHSFGGFTSVGVPCRDDRFKLSVPHAPVISLTQVFGCDLDAFPVPLMVMGGTADNTLKWFDQYCDYYRMRAPKRYLYELERGGHFTFSDMCTLDLYHLAVDLDFGDAAGALNDGCHETDNVPYREAHKSINYYATAFFNYYMRGSTASLDYLVEKSESPFDEVNFYEGDVPEWEGGCSYGELK